MKAALLLCLAVACLLSGAVSERKVSNRRQRFEEWRECMVATLPEEKATEYQNCHERARGTSMRKFREGLRCVLGSYGIVNRNSVNLTAMAAAASSINKTELKKAFQDCPEDDHNAQIAKAVKCVIDSLEVMKRNNVDSAALIVAACNITKPEVRKALKEYRPDEHSAQRCRLLKEP